MNNIARIGKLKIYKKFLIVFIPVIILSNILIVWLINSNLSKIKFDIMKKDVYIQSKLISRVIDKYGNQALELATMFAMTNGVNVAYKFNNEAAGKDYLKKIIAPIVERIKKNTELHQFKVHFHKPPAKSFLREWNNSGLDDLSGFRRTVQYLSTRKKPLQTIEIGKGGFAIRGIAPIFDDNGDYLGSVEVFYDIYEILPVIKNPDDNDVGFSILINKEAAKNLFFEEQIDENFKEQIGISYITNTTNDWIKPDQMFSEKKIGLSYKEKTIQSSMAKSVMSTYIPIVDFKSNVIGMFVYVKNFETQFNKFDSLTRMINVFMAILGLVILTIVIVLLIVIVSRPLKKLNLVMAEIAKGEGDLTTTINITSKDEIGSFANDFNMFIISLKAIIARLKGTSKQNMQIKHELNESTEDSLANLNEITGQVTTITDEIEHLDSSIAVSKKSLVTISDTVTSLNTQIESQTAAVSETSAAVTQMIASIENIAEVTRQKQESTNNLEKTALSGGNKVKETYATIENITENVDDMLEMINIINEVASQTDLLSMNAAIEAAHAGEAGKSFAVVADEIRSLAESVSENSKSISLILQKTVNNIQEASIASKEARDAFDEINTEIVTVVSAFHEISSTAQELSAGGKQILDAMNILNETSTMVKEGSSGISKNTDTLNLILQELSGISSSVVTGINTISNKIEKISNKIINVSGLSGILGGSTEQMDNDINKFKT